MEAPQAAAEAQPVRKPTVEAKAAEAPPAKRHAVDAAKADAQAPPEKRPRVEAKQPAPAKQPAAGEKPAADAPPAATRPAQTAAPGVAGDITFSLRVVGPAGRPPKKFTLRPTDKLVIGRKRECDFTVTGRGISYEHCEIYLERKGRDMLLKVRDTSTNFTGILTAKQSESNMEARLAKEIAKGETEVLQHGFTLIVPQRIKQGAAPNEFGRTHIRVELNLPDAYCRYSQRGRWDYLEKLGEGGLAVVYRAKDMEKLTKDEVAIKVSKFCYMGQASQHNRHIYALHREAQWSIQCLHNPRHAKYNDKGAKVFMRYIEDHTGFDKEFLGDFNALRERFEDPKLKWDQQTFSSELSSRPYIVMELIRGQLLQNAIDLTPGLSNAEKKEIVTQSIEALCYMQDFGVIHRDFRGCNLFIEGKGPCIRLRVIDLGFLVSSEKKQMQNPNTAVRCAWQGDPAKKVRFDWAPPEVRRRNVVLNFAEPPTSFDVYSLGVLILKLCKGRHWTAAVLPSKLTDLSLHGEVWKAVGLSTSTLSKMLDQEDAGRRPWPVELLKEVTGFERLSDWWSSGQYLDRFQGGDVKFEKPSAAGSTVKGMPQNAHKDAKRNPTEPNQDDEASGSSARPLEESNVTGMPWNSMMASVVTAEDAGQSIRSPAELHNTSGRAKDAAEAAQYRADPRRPLGRHSSTGDLRLSTLAGAVHSPTDEFVGCSSPPPPQLLTMLPGRVTSPTVEAGWNSFSFDPHEEAYVPELPPAATMLETSKRRKPSLSSSRTQMQSPDAKRSRRQTQDIPILERSRRAQSRSPDVARRRSQTPAIVRSNSAYAEEVQRFQKKAAAFASKRSAAKSSGSAPPPSGAAQSGHRAAALPLFQTSKSHPPLPPAGIASQLLPACPPQAQKVAHHAHSSSSSSSQRHAAPERTSKEFANMLGSSSISTSASSRRGRHSVSMSVSVGSGQQKSLDAERMARSTDTSSRAQSAQIFRDVHTTDASRRNVSADPLRDVHSTALVERLQSLSACRQESADSSRRQKNAGLSLSLDPQRSRATRAYRQESADSSRSQTKTSLDPQHQGSSRRKNVAVLQPGPSVHGSGAQAVTLCPNSAMTSKAPASSFTPLPQKSARGLLQEKQSVSVDRHSQSTSVTRAISTASLARVTHGAEIRLRSSSPGTAAQNERSASAHSRYVKGMSAARGKSKAVPLPPPPPRKRVYSPRRSESARRDIEDGSDTGWRESPPPHPSLELIPRSSLSSQRSASQPSRRLSVGKQQSGSRAMNTLSDYVLSDAPRCFSISRLIEKFALDEEAANTVHSLKMDENFIRQLHRELPDKRNPSSYVMFLAKVRRENQLERNQEQSRSHRRSRSISRTHARSVSRAQEMRPRSLMREEKDRDASSRSGRGLRPAPQGRAASPKRHRGYESKVDKRSAAPRCFSSSASRSVSRSERNSSTRKNWSRSYSPHRAVVESMLSEAHRRSPSHWRPSK